MNIYSVSTVCNMSPAPPGDRPGSWLLIPSSRWAGLLGKLPLEARASRACYICSWHYRIVTITNFGTAHASSRDARDARESLFAKSYCLTLAGVLPPRHCRPAILRVSRCCVSGRAEVWGPCWEAGTCPRVREPRVPPREPDSTSAAFTPPLPLRSPRRRKWTTRSWRKTCTNTPRSPSKVRPGVRGSLAWPGSLLCTVIPRTYRPSSSLLV